MSIASAALLKRTASTSISTSTYYGHMMDIRCELRSSVSECDCIRNLEFTKATSKPSHLSCAGVVLVIIARKYHRKSKHALCTAYNSVITAVTGLKN